MEQDLQHFFGVNTFHRDNYEYVNLSKALSLLELNLTQHCP